MILRSRVVAGALLCEYHGIYARVNVAGVNWILFPKAMSVTQTVVVAAHTGITWHKNQCARRTAVHCTRTCFPFIFFSPAR